MSEKKSRSKGKAKAAPSVQQTPTTGETAPQLTPAQLAALHHAYDAKIDSVVMTVDYINGMSESLSTDEHYQGAVFTLTDFDALAARKLMSIQKGVYQITRAGEKQAEAERGTETPTSVISHNSETTRKEKTLDSYIESLQFAAAVEKLTGKDKAAMHSALTFAEQLDLKFVLETEGKDAPVTLSFDERLLISAYRSGDYHLFSCVADDLLKDEKRADELEKVRGYKPLEARDVSERDSDTFYTLLEIMALDVTAYLAKGWIPRGVMFFDNNYIQMLFGIAETMLQSLIEDRSLGELSQLDLWLRYQDEIEAATEGAGDE